MRYNQHDTLNWTCNRNCDVFETIYRTRNPFCFGIKCLVCTILFDNLNRQLHILYYYCVYDTQVYLYVIECLFFFLRQKQTFEPEGFHSRRPPLIILYYIIYSESINRLKRTLALRPNGLVKMLADSYRNLPARVAIKSTILFGQQIEMSFRMTAKTDPRRIYVI